MDFSILSILLSFLFGLLFVIFLRRFDQYEKEPYWKMFATTLIGGAVSIVVCTLLYGFVDGTPLSAIEHRSMAGSLFIIGPVEEVAKLIGLLAAWPLIRKEINEVNDGLVYMACVALGFSLIENYSYANANPDAHYLLYYRLFITSPAHIAFSLFIGMAFYRFKIGKAKISILIYALIWASLVHGLYDGFIFENWGALSLLVFIVGLQQAMVLVRVGNLRSPFKTSFDSFLRRPRRKARESVCPSCHTPQSDNVIQYQNIRIHDCGHCRMMYGEKRQLIKLYHYYIPPLGLDILRMRRVRLLGQKSRLFTLRKLFFFKNRSDKMGYFNPLNFVNMLNVYKRSVRMDFKSRWYSPGRYIAVFDKTRKVVD